jgi:hypothetical protein
MELSEAEIVDKIQRMLRSAEGSLLIEKVRAKHMGSMNVLRHSDGLAQIHRAQGELSVLNWILELRSSDGVLE